MMYREPDPHADALSGYEPVSISLDDSLADALPAATPDGTDFAALHSALKPWGGMIEGETLARMLQERGAGDFSMLAKAIVSRQLIAVQHAGRQWVPAFQFDAHMAVRSRVRRIVLELKGTFEPAALATWFIERNAWLRQRRPLEVIDTQFGDVWNAAGADRFVASGMDELQ